MEWGAARVLTATLACVLASHARAADKPDYGPPGSWVRDIPIPTDLKPTGAAVDVLLLDQQQRLFPGGGDAFVELATRVNASEGLAALGSIIETWDPSTQALTIHRARIIRNGGSIDLLAGGKTFTILRRETNLEAATIDGQLTATLQPEGLRLGDIVDVAVTLTRREPAFGDHADTAIIGAQRGMIHRLVVRTSWPKTRSPSAFETDDLPRLSRSEAGDRVELGFEQNNAFSPEAPKGAPAFESAFGMALMSDFSGWNEVSKTIYPLFDKAATLPANSPLRAQIARIAAAHLDPKSRSLAALQLVEGDIRYLAVLLNAGGYTPATADLTWSRRFGDCKGKTVMLLALLRGLGVDAVPALVNTTGGDGLDRFPPMMDVFDHVILKVTIGGATYWLDGARQGDEDLDILPVPNYHFDLPLTLAGAALEPLVPRDPVLPTLETHLQVDLSAGLDKPAKLRRELIFRGDVALGLKLGLNAATVVDRERALRRMLADEDWMKPDKLDFTYEPKTMTFTGMLEGQGSPPFTTPDGGGPGLRDWEPAPAFVKVTSDLRRTSDYHRDAPYLVEYPGLSRDVVEITLPNRGNGFTVTNAGAVNREAAGVVYSRAATINDGRFVEVISRRATKPTFPASEAASAETALKNLGNYEVSLRYEPKAAPVAANSASTAGGPDEDPEERARAAFSAKDYASADAEYSEALTLKPSAKTYYNRAVVRGAMGKIALAEADLKQSLVLDPQEPMALFALGRLGLERGEFAEAARRFAKAFDAASEKAAMSRRVAQSYYGSGRYAEAVPYWDRAVTADPAADHQKAMDLKADCWTRTRIAMDLQKAHALCVESLGLAPKDFDSLNIMGANEFRLAHLEAAIERFNEALALNPASADARFGRSLAERRLGQAAKADLDLAAAHAIDPKVEAGLEGLTSP